MKGTRLRRLAHGTRVQTQHSYLDNLVHFTAGRVTTRHSCMPRRGPTLVYLCRATSRMSGNSCMFLRETQRTRRRAREHTRSGNIPGGGVPRVSQQNRNLVEASAPTRPHWHSLSLTGTRHGRSGPRAATSRSRCPCCTACAGWRRSRARCCAPTPATTWMSWTRSWSAAPPRRATTRSWRRPASGSGAAPARPRGAPPLAAGTLQHTGTLATPVASTEGDMRGLVTEARRGHSRRLKTNKNYTACTATKKLPRLVEERRRN